MLCPVGGVGVEVVGRDAIGHSDGGDDLRATGCGGSDQCRLARRCDSSSGDGASGDGEACVAWRMVTAAGPGAGRRAAPRLCERDGRAGVVRALALPAHRPLRVASATAGAYRRHVSASPERSLSPVSGVGAADRHAGGRRGDSLSRAAAPAQLYTPGPVGGRR